MDYEKIGGWAFILGVVIAVVAGLVSAYLAPASAGFVTLALVILGLVVGFLNIADKEIRDFMIAAIALILVGTANLAAIPLIGKYLASMVLNVAAFVAPAALIVALKAVYNLASKPAK